MRLTDVAVPVLELWAGGDWQIGHRADGRRTQPPTSTTAHLQVQPVERADKKIRILVRTASLARAGFTAAATAKDGVIEISPGQPFTATFSRSAK